MRNKTGILQKSEFMGHVGHETPTSLPKPHSHAPKFVWGHESIRCRDLSILPLNKFFMPPCPTCPSLKFLTRFIFEQLGKMGGGIQLCTC